MKQDREKKTDSKKAGRIVLIILIVLLSLAIVGTTALILVIRHTLNLIPRATEPETTLSWEQIQAIENGEDEQTDPVTQPSMTDPGADATAPTEGVTVPTAPPTSPVEEVIVPGWTPKKIQADHLINILLIGQDRREGEGRARSDAMVLCTFNLKTKTLTMTSFLRDLYVQIPGYRDNRMNAAYALGGMKLLDRTLEQNFGVVVDGNVEVDFKKFEAVVDLLGGVDISLTSGEAEVLGLSAGVNHLDGTMALRYSRIRRLDSDFGRTNRQRKVLQSLIQAYRNKPIDQMIALLDDLLPIVTTDMTNTEIVDVVMKVFPMLSDMSVTTQHIPAAGTYTNARIRGMAVLCPDFDANHQLLVESLLKP